MQSADSGCFCRNFGISFHRFEFSCLDLQVFGEMFFWCLESVVDILCCFHMLMDILFYIFKKDIYILEILLNKVIILL